MIAFSCSRCGMKFQVKTQFAGRSTRCPTCKQPLVVPAPGRNEAIAAGEIEGTSSSLVQAGVDAGVTLKQPARPEPNPTVDLLARRPRKGERYLVEREIARGGMGTILRAVDCDIRREVAVKYLLDQADPRKKARFVEEAQITGQLEHPNIVPIHELGVDAYKRLFFSMKMVKGRSLAQVLEDLRQRPKTAERDYPLARLLTIFVNFCNALGYAHARGVVHRDLKPANIMIGDFGEVYVMDWGLAKVQEAGVRGQGAGGRGQGSGVGSQEPGTQQVAVSSKVATSREPEADLTQEGAVLGTPVYMPPEQATGQIDAIDARSDIYSLGAILYEMLTLQPPVDRDGGYLAILMRVTQGDIVPAEQRNPSRAGKVPRELSAVAMKALAKDKVKRYPTVEALRQDIERFQEGRSVSAKEDTVREAVWKLAKRNRGASVTAIAALIVLLVVLWFSFRSIYKAKVEAESALAAKRQRGEKSAPLFLRDARGSADRGEFDHALAQVNVALEYDPDKVEARLLKGQLLIVLKDFPAAQNELAAYLRQQPKDENATQLLALCRTARRGDTTASAPFVEVFDRQNALVFAAQMTQDRDKKLELYRKQIDKAWSGFGQYLRLDKDGKLGLNLNQGSSVVKSLTPLQGLPLAALDLSNCTPGDLTPLQGMPLESLNLRLCKGVRDLAPLQGLPLVHLNLDLCGVRDLTPLHGMPLATLSLQGCDQFSDLTPLRGLKLTALNISETQVRDLGPLRGMPLTNLSMRYCREVTDLGPLAGMPLNSLDLYACGQVRDLSALRGMPLTFLGLLATTVRDLTPLQGLKLTEIQLELGGDTKGVDVLRPMKSLKTVVVGTKGTFTADEFWKKYDRGEFK
jgi:serine/threonine protein kinase